MIKLQTLTIKPQLFTLIYQQWQECFPFFLVKAKVNIKSPYDSTSIKLASYNGNYIIQMIM